MYQCLEVTKVPTRLHLSNSKSADQNLSLNSQNSTPLPRCAPGIQTYPLIITSPLKGFTAKEYRSVQTRSPAACTVGKTIMSDPSCFLCCGISRLSAPNGCTVPPVNIDKMSGHYIWFHPPGGGYS